MSGGKVTMVAGSTAGPVGIFGNSAVQGGGIYLSSGTLSLNRIQLNNNTASQSGGAILNLGTVVITSSTIDHDVAVGSDGGGIDDAGKLTIADSTFTNNSATDDGGSIRNLGSGTVTINTSSIALSSAVDGGDIANSGTLTIIASTVSSGFASQIGGGIFNAFNSPLSLTNSTIAQNSSISGGGGIYSLGTLTSINATIANNNGGTGSGLDVASGTALLYNTIVDSNTTNGGTDVAGTLDPASSNNLFGSGADSLGGTTNLFDVANPHLDPNGLQNNGGQTQTIALLTGSPAIDAGTNTIAGQTVPTLDQRGAVRGTAGINAGANVDIGAYEASSSYLITSAVDSTSISGTLRSGLEWATFSTNDNPENLAPNTPAPNTLVFDTTGTFGVPQTITLTSTLTMPTAQAVAIDGPGGGVVTISGGGIHQVVNVPFGAVATLEGITITGRHGQCRRRHREQRLADADQHDPRG